MILGIDASNIGSGGGVAHLKGVVSRAVHVQIEVTEIIVWAREEILEHISNNKKIRRIPLSDSPRSPFSRIRWQLGGLGEDATRKGCAILLVPGGIYWGTFRPYVVIVQNMQVFEWSELKREGLTTVALKLLVLMIVQGLTLYRATGVIFLSKYCSTYFQENWSWLVKGKEISVIPHGVNHQAKWKSQRPIDSYSSENPFCIVYVSTVRNYKHPWNLIEAVYALYELGYPIALNLVGGGESSAIRRLKRSIQKCRSAGDFVHYHGALDYESTLKCLERADLFAFPSSCESFGLSLLEAMAYGLPIACSNRGPLPELLGDAGAYFDPLDPDSIEVTLRSLVDDHEQRSRLAKAAWERSKLYSWEKCAHETLHFLHKVSNVAKA